MTEITRIPGIGAALALRMAEAGITSAEQIAKARIEDLTAVQGISVTRATLFIAAAKKLVGGLPAPTKRPAKTRNAAADRRPLPKPAKPAKAKPAVVKPAAVLPVVDLAGTQAEEPPAPAAAVSGASKDEAQKKAAKKAQKKAERKADKAAGKGNPAKEKPAKEKSAKEKSKDKKKAEKPKKEKSEKAKSEKSKRKKDKKKKAE